MKQFSRLHPVVLFFYFCAALGVTMFCLNPAVQIISLGGALLLNLIVDGKPKKRRFLPLLMIPLGGLLNPVFSHHGQTILFFLNNNPVTLQAIYYGLNMGGTACAVLFWLSCFTQIMSSDKLLCVFGRFSPKLALMLSLILRFVPLLGRRSRESREALQAIGLFREDNFFWKLRSRVRVFFAVATSALENGIIAADSMEARGYSVGRRTAYSVFHFSWADGVFAFVSAAALGVVLIVLRAMQLDFYPTVTLKGSPVACGVGLAAFALLCLLPGALQGIAGLVRKRNIRRSLAYGKEAETA
ncbi:MAG: energy-coupling factor transporter transmembrane protein EcfT [Clostridia bacterium]|nr:energy-coupling factor transporter transmembrane protein EcfT [Clostridia bacterium]